ncbi:hypothetical protein D0A34_01140 [Microcoleus vaginatus PCC 9802]|nr:hypothetical protein MicvaDRAFT_2426 [Microcoleus vaginatus FGP-2]UNU17642.1 hypothetical protein D0A34_01140 [Microcoleus vaginatus PCC 9802]
MILPPNYNLLPIAEGPTLIIILQTSLLNEPRRRKEREGREERGFYHFEVEYLPEDIYLSSSFFSFAPLRLIK